MTVLLICKENLQINSTKKLILAEIKEEINQDGEVVNQEDGEAKVAKEEAIKDPEGLEERVAKEVRVVKIMHIII